MRTRGRISSRSCALGPHLLKVMRTRGRISLRSCALGPHLLKVVRCPWTCGRPVLRDRPHRSAHAAASVCSSGGP
uniref:Uncharacterized protein n=1 Tax=Janibacter limosus TaxID=53458 RepID=A0AC61U317_9MICO|nr:hypothetical protein [Janibacter limosus]